MKKHREKAKNTGERQGKHREFCFDRSVATLFQIQNNVGSNFGHGLNFVLREQTFRCKSVHFTVKGGKAGARENVWTFEAIDYRRASEIF